MSHQICLATYPESLSSNSSSWPKITWYHIKEIKNSYNMYWMHNVNIFSSCHNFINQIEEWLCFDLWGSKWCMWCMLVMKLSNFSPYSHQNIFSFMPIYTHLYLILHIYSEFWRLSTNLTGSQALLTKRIPWGLADIGCLTENYDYQMG